MSYQTTAPLLARTRLIFRARLLAIPLSKIEENTVKTVTRLNQSSGKSSCSAFPSMKVNAG
jgi:hypothetical protein